MDVFIEPLVPAPHLYVLGAGHVGYHVARLGSMAGFRVHVLDDREKFASAQRFPDAEVIVDDIAAWLDAHPLPPGAFAVIVTRGHRHDLEALRALIRQDLRYLGLIGSRAKVARLSDMLASEGVDATRLHRVHAPIGLDIGAVTPEEIAIAIVAELIAVKYGKVHAGDAAGTEAVRLSRWQRAGAKVTA
jgi:xanthine dehydrogenase accessory factor